MQLVLGVDPNGPFQAQHTLADGGTTQGRGTQRDSVVVDEEAGARLGASVQRADVHAIVGAECNVARHGLPEGLALGRAAGHGLRAVEHDVRPEREQVRRRVSAHGRRSAQLVLDLDNVKRARGHDEHFGLAKAGEQSVLLVRILALGFALPLGGAIGRGSLVVESEGLADVVQKSVRLAQVERGRVGERDRGLERSVHGTKVVRPIHLQATGVKAWVQSTRQVCSPAGRS